MKLLPRYPVYVPSKGRWESGYTAKFLNADSVPFWVVVEPQEADAYAARVGRERLLVLPWAGDDEKRRAFCAERGIENGGLIAARNWIKEHATDVGHERHWQLDDNIRCLWRRYKARKFSCDAAIALRAAEDLADRYENVALAGLNYYMFAANGEKAPPFQVNCHVYSCTLVLNSLPYRWRIAYNDDTDLCLQVLSGGWCTVLVNAFLAEKKTTMTVKGGNTADLYQGDGRLYMAKALERLWPGVVETKRRFRRPQHVVKDAWKRFDTPLRLKPGIDLAAMEPNEYGMELKQVKPIKSESLRQLVADHEARRVT